MIFELFATALRDAILTHPTLLEGLIPLFSSVPPISKSSESHAGLAELPRASLIMRFAAIGAVLAGIVGLFLQWHLVITVGQPGDPTNDATLPWPPNRQQVDAGTLTIDHVESKGTSPARDINFDPLVLPYGIATSDDPLLSTRSAAYSQSFTRREGERKEPSAVSTAETEK